MNVEYTADSTEPEILKLVTPLATDAQTVPSAENILSFGTLAEDGSFKTITTEITVTEIKQTSKGYQLSGVDYSDSLFDYGTIPQYQTNLTKPRGSLGKIPLSNDNLLNKVEEVKKEVESFVSVDVVNSVQPPADVSSCVGIAEKDGINLSAVAGGSTIFDNVKNFVYEISRDGGNNWESVNGSYYAFDRTKGKDGYPEKSAFVNYKIRSKAINSYGINSKNWKKGLVSPSDNYGTWILSAPTVTAKATEGIIEISINDEKNASVWGVKTYTLSYTDTGNKCTKSLVKKDERNYTLDIAGLYLEKADIAKITFTATVTNGAGTKTGTCPVNTDNYGTWILSAPTVTAKATEGIIEISINDEKNASVWGVKTYTLSYTDTGNKCTKSLVKKDERNYTLDIAGLYLEKADIAKITFTATVNNGAGTKTGTCTVNTDNYGTYVPAPPSVSVSVSGRGVALGFSHNHFYDFSNYEIQISKDKTTWYSFGSDDTGRNNENAWKGTKNAVTSVKGNYIAFVLALSGESSNLPIDTTYYFRSRTKGYSNNVYSDWIPTTAIARCTLANDIAANAVKTAQIENYAVTVDKIKANAVTAQKISVENIASIQAILGDVTTGSIASHGKIENGKDVPDPENSLLYLNGKNGSEEFYIGNVAKSLATDTNDSHEFLWFRKINNVFSISFKISNFIVTSVASIIKGLFKIRADSGTDFVTVNPNDAVKSMIVNGTVSAKGNFIGNLSGNADTATKLATARTLNIQDASATNTGTGASFNGSGNATIKLPATIKANITGNVSGSSGSCTGNAATATTLKTARTLNIQDADGSNTGTGASFNGSANATIKLPATIKATLTGNASTATKLATARTLNIQDADGSNTGTGASFNGSANATIKLPATIKAECIHVTQICPKNNIDSYIWFDTDADNNSKIQIYSNNAIKIISDNGINITGDVTHTGTIIPKAGTFDGATVSIGRDDGMVTIGNTTNSIGGWTTINNDCKMLGSLLINDHCHIRNYPAISGETSTDSAGNLVLNLYTN